MGENKLAMIVLAGGASSRMGKEKSDLKLDGKSFLEIQIQKGRELGVDRIYVSGYRGAHCTEESVMEASACCGVSSTMVRYRRVARLRANR